MIPKTENMTEWFKRVGRPSGVSVSNLYLAAFGKHPGWEDHIPGIGVDTESLAALKQSLYLDGIRGQIDSGAWEKMEQIKRLEGFDHSFLWLRPGLVLFGLMWSSTDRVGRAKYPMILCAEGDGFSPGFMLACAKPELERLRETCKSLASADEVMSECRAAQDRLRGIFERAQAGWVEPFSNVAERQQFLDSAELSPDREGFLRILHEYSTEQGGLQKAKHLRVPVVNSVPADAFTPWVEFFKCLVPAKVPVLFIKRHDSAWLDVIKGEPASSDFFCLQAATDALPLTTQVPYEISPETRSALETVSSRLGLPAAGAPAKQPRRQAPQVPKAPPQSASVQPKSGGRAVLVITVILVLVLAAVALVLLLKARNAPLKAAPQATHNPPASAPAVSAVAAEGKKYDTAIQAATDAFAKGNYDEAIRQANIALDAEPGDQAATQIKTDATNKKRDAAAQADAQQRQKQYEAAMASGREALENKNYSEASRQAGIALSFEGGDISANALMAQALNAQSDEKKKQEYEAAMASAREAIVSKNYSLAIQKAEDALAAMPGDADAVRLKSEAQSVQARDGAYQTAIQAAQMAFNNKNFDVAAQQAANALAVVPGDVTATTLRDNALAAGNTQKKSMQDQSEVRAVQDAWSRNDFNAVIQHASLALQVSPDQPDVKAKLRDSVYNELEMYAVWFGVIKPQSASFAGAKKLSPLAEGDMPPSQATAYKNQIDAWIKLLNQYQLLDDPHTKLAQAVEANINRY
ncbi:MAG TPA: hypothetical protein VGY56_21930 [Verrucomicrobiae bacterium]|nr:hypothetical protein [Verrucomicrobiae bacterium]